MAEIEVSRNGQTVEVTLNRPDKRNALNLAMWQGLAEALAAADADETLRCVVLRGAGGNFAAGADLAEFAVARATTAQAESYGRTMLDALNAIRSCRHPTIAAIQGLCVGGGLEIALMCDLRLVTPDSRFGIPIQKVGIAMPYPELAILTQILGSAVMLEMLLEAQLHDAAWAERRGLATRLVADLEAELHAATGRIAAGSPMSHRHHKRLVHRAAQANLTVDEETVRLSYAAVETADYREGIQAFLQRRAANFTGN
ncbi:MAG TPA: enoyl-CoA hydratase-related protein [Alphaproteobacteria bacterium]|nr:enoyl-CoA hydratase-related protein [Alphaproteobacteria bacterium]